MSQSFDPYHKWLGIPPAEQPPSHYRLLGLRPFEDDPDVIESAADQRMAHLRTFQAGKQSKLSQQLLNEISAARVCLLKPDKRQVYDDQLRAKLAALAPLAGEESDLLSGAVLADEPPAPGLNPLAAAPLPVVTRAKRRARGRSPRWVLPALLTGGALVALVAILIVVFVVKPFDDPSPRDVAQSPDGNQRPPVTDKTATTPPAEIPASNDGQPDTATQNGSVDTDPPDPKPPATVDPPDPAGNLPKTTVDPPATTPMPADGDEPASSPFEVVKPPVEPAPPIARKPIPSQTQQDTVLAQLAEIFDLAGTKTSEQKLELANSLFKVGGQSQDNPDEQFVLLNKAKQLAVEAGDAGLAMSTLDKLAESFDINRMDEAHHVLLDTAKNATRSESVAALLDASQRFLEQAIADERFDAARTVAGAVYSAASKPTVDSEIRKQAFDQRNRIQDLHDKWQTVQDAVAKLKTDPDDPRANLAAGLWYCFAQGDWERGLACLAKSNDATLRPLAERELNSEHSNYDDRVALADAWWDAAANATGDQRAAMRLRAGRWYLMAQAVSPDEAMSLKLKQRLGEFGDLDAVRKSIAREMRPDGKKILLVTPDTKEFNAAKELCERYFIECEVVRSFDVNRTDYNNCHTILAGSNAMDYWGKEEAKIPAAFQHVEQFVAAGGHLIVLGTYNGRNSEHLQRFGIKTGIYHTGTFERTGEAADLLFRGVEHLFPKDGKMASAGNFTVSVPHVVILKRGPGSHEGEPALATAPYKLGRVTCTLCEPSWRGDMWLLEVLVAWIARGAPTPPVPNAK